MTSPPRLALRAWVPSLLLCSFLFQLAAHGKDVTVKVWEHTFPRLHSVADPKADTMAFEVLQVGYLANSTNANSSAKRC
jgi:hypothetical protein